MSGNNGGLPDRMTASVAMATLDGAAFLTEQLESLVDQRRKPDELVVSDDASSDSTVEILQTFAQKAPFPVTVLRNDMRAGVAQNFEQTIRRCVGDLIFLCDQDDVWQPDKIDLLATAMERDESAGMAFGDLELIDETGASLGRTQWQRLRFDPSLRRIFAIEPLKVLLRYNVVTGAGAAVRASLLPMLLPISPMWLPDEWFALLTAATGRLAVVDAPLVRYRQHQAQQVGGAVAGWRDQLAAARKRMDAPYMLRSAERSRAAMRHLANHRDLLRVPQVLDSLARRAEHFERRAEWRQANLSRVPSIIKELADGQYHRFDYGWKAALFDLAQPDDPFTGHDS
jgi:glycosyltransferase involved in cell wall biosynthesis